MKIYTTAYAELGYAEFDAGCWHIVRISQTGQPPVIVGSEYPTREALLAALPDYAATNWGYPSVPGNEATPGMKDLISRLSWALEGFYAAESCRRQGITPCEAGLDILFEEVEALRPIVGRMFVGSDTSPSRPPDHIPSPASGNTKAIRAVVGMGSMLRRSGTSESRWSWLPWSRAAATK